MGDNLVCTKIYWKPFIYFPKVHICVLLIIWLLFLQKVKSRKVGIGWKKNGLYYSKKNLPCLCCVCTTWEFSVSQYNNSLLAWPIYFQRENSSFYTVHLPRYAMHNALKSLFMNCALTKFLPNVQNVTFWRVTRYGFAKNCAKTTNNSRLGDFCEKTHLVHNSKIHNLHLIAGLFLAKPIW